MRFKVAGKSLAGLVLFSLNFQASGWVIFHDRSFLRLDQCPVFRKPFPDSLTVEKYRQIVLEAAKTSSPLTWPSQYLRNTVVESESRVREIIDLLVQENSPLMKEVVDNVVARTGGLQSSELWDRYFGSYDKILMAIPDNINIFAQASQILPPSGDLLDIGSGTGNEAILLKLLAPARKIHGYDFSCVGAGQASCKAKFVGEPGDVTFDRFDVTQLSDVEMWDGALMNNVLYTISDKEDMLRRIFRALKPGKLLVLNDPLPRIKSVEQNIAAQLAFMQTAVRNQSPMTEFDMAFVVALNLRKLIAQADLIHDEALMDLIARAGFEVQSVEQIYFGSMRSLVLRRP